MNAISTLTLPNAPVLVAGRKQAAWITPDGEMESLPLAEAARRVVLEPPILCHARATAERLGQQGFAAYDLLELYAFVHPARFCLPTPRGLIAALGLPVPADAMDEATGLLDAAKLMIETVASPARGSGGIAYDRSARAVAKAMQACGWRWAPFLLAALGEPVSAEPGPVRPVGLDIWRDLPEWSEDAPPPSPSHFPVDPMEARDRLAQLLGENAEPRPSQADYASAATAAFAPREEEDQPNVVLAEAGTGVGKTLGYVAPASVWAEKNKGTVWLSTYTRNLQHQIDGELDRLFPDPAVKAQKVVIRKGRENYLCLLNLEEAVRALPMRPQDGVALGLMARWAAATRDGDMVGGDFPAWLAHLLGRARTLGLSDKRGECIYSACQHYHKCYVEKSIRRARRAEIVIANHALVMIQAALGGGDGAGDGPSQLPTRYVFDEGHHVFDAADGAFAGHLTAQEMIELRRWLLGSEGRGASRARGLKTRVEDLIANDGPAADALREILHSARALPSEGWNTRITEGKAEGPAESLLAAMRQQVYARQEGRPSAYGMETESHPPVDGLLAAAAALEAALGALLRPIQTLKQRIAAMLDREADQLDTATKQRIEAVLRSLTRRGEVQLGGWRSMLKALGEDTPAEFVDWFAVDRIEGRDIDYGMYRHWVDPTVPFIRTVAEPAHGVLITSATLRDGSGEVERDWAAAEARTGSRHLAMPAVRVAVRSPFDYPAQTRVMIVNDVRKDDLDQVAAAYRSLFLASGGGGLGLFTAISRLRGVHARIAGPLDGAGIPLYAQHVDGLDTATLIDIFRAEEAACLLGTDAVRDGVDVPGHSLRLLVFDRVPWPRPDILHRARREYFGKRAYDDMITRLRLKQAFGRLVRRGDDRGVFVLLDPMMPSRLCGAFPEGVEVQRIGLAEAVSRTKEFFGEAATPAQLRG
ncbi:MAG: ATP-dependent DNA helicase [Alphaproteobacteria bacterium]|nr:ATP-dependent DNA helicase [Alphaproteobacteria bacterium]MBU0796361.1 ATP-dependent DNA helicase [Alphaproteobacteria bacterium]MBU0888606.1 ATP-dependent DNA helicase [Alphaproteobacteria bacterium]MBU1813660.1 ATP-dependent DNA helicase [Alphaproteobacteria bacterium]